jgi:hypothetical protein
MPNAKDILESSRLEMRWRVLSLAADFDRIEPAADDPYVNKLRQALGIILDGAGRRAERVQMLFSDTTPGPL